MLRQELQTRKKRNANYSLRSFAKALEMSPAQLSQLMSGQRSLTLKMFQKIIEKLSISPTESERYLKQWSLGNTASAGFVSELQLSEDQFKLISDWYHLAILSLARVEGATTDPHWISDRLGISSIEARQAVERLQRLAIIGPGPELLQISKNLNVSSELQSPAIQAYHRGVLHSAIESLDLDQPSERDFSALTLAVHRKNLDRYRRLIESFQKELSDISEKDSKKTPPQEVYVFACQFFPLKKRKKV